jgi:orotate phosphoribosyltransferase
VVQSNDKAALLKILAETSFREGKGGEFLLSSGKRSEFYVDCKMALSYPQARRTMGNLIATLVQGDEIDAVGGLEIGAYPIAAAVSDAIFADTGKVVRAFVVRKNAKKHGLMKWIEGDIPQHGNALVVDDVTTTGGSVTVAIKRIRQSGLIVRRAILLVDREEPDASAAIEALGVRFDALFTLTELRSARGDTTRPDAIPDPARTVAG